jgi:holin (3TMs family)
MGSFAAIFKGLISGDPLKSATDFIEQFHLSPEQAAQIKQAAAELEVRRDEIVAARDQALNEIAGQNIRTETSSSDWVVRRARPAFLWMMILALFLNIAIFPLIQAAWTKQIKPIDIPSPLLELFGTAFLGYVVPRTIEKLKDKD